jgi:hypothetical protein
MRAILLPVRLIALTVCDGSCMHAYEMTAHLHRSAAGNCQGIRHLSSKLVPAQRLTWKAVVRLRPCECAALFRAISRPV